MAEQPELGFAGLLRQLRAEARLTQEELAEAAGVSPRSVSDLERGVNRTARRDTAELLAGPLGLSGPVREQFVAAARGKAPAGQVLTAVRGAGPQPPGMVTASPYRGLAMYEKQDWAFFFGREAAASEVLDRMSQLLAGMSMLVVSGVSGAGKSSLLRAGVLPRIQAAGLAAAPGAASWPCLVFTPAREPLDELALRVAPLAGADAAAVRRGLETDPARFALTAQQAAMAQPSGAAGDLDSSAGGRDQPPRQRRLLLVVDQFEELFTQCDQEGQRRAFITALHATAGHGPEKPPAGLVVLAVRADFEARCAEYPQLAGAVQDRYLVTPMTERQLRMAITEPAKKAGSKVDDDLAGVLLTEVRNGQPGTFAGGVLPLLSHALDQAWRCRTGEEVTLAEYERTGGIEGAVAASAQRAYDQLTPGQQAAARQVFLRLTATSSDGVDTVAHVTRAELTEGSSAAQARDVEVVLEAFAAERLLTLAAGTVEISHEALLTAWPLLRDTWLADTHADRIVRTRLHTTAAEWARQSRDRSYLYSGSLLQAASDTAARIGADPARHPPLSQTERDFLHASSRAHRRAVRRRQAFTAFLMALVIGLASATALAIRASQQTAHQRDIAVSGQLISQSSILGDTSPTISKLLSIAAWRIHPSKETRYAMLAAAARPEIAVLSGHAGPVVSVAFSPDGKTLATGSYDHTVQLWDVATGRQIGELLNSQNGPTESMAFSPDGKTLATGGGDGTLRLWDVAAGHQIGHTLADDFGGIFAVTFSPDGKTLAIGGNDTVLWDVTTGHQIGSPLPSHSGSVSAVAFSPDGKTLATALNPVEQGVPNGKAPATGSQDGAVRLWNVATGHQIGSPLTGHTGMVDSVAFSPDGKTLAIGSEDGAVRLRDVATGRQIGSPLTGHTGMVSVVAFSRDGKTLASGSDDSTVRLWDVATGRQIGGQLTGHTGSIRSVAFSPDGKTLATGSDDATARLWNVAYRTGIATFTGSAAGAASVVFGPENATLAAVSGDGAVQLWNVATGRQIGHTFTGHTGHVIGVALSPDGKTVAIGSEDSTTRLWDVATGRQIGHTLTGPTGMVDPEAFSPDGKTVAIGSYDGTTRLWDVATGRQIGPTLTGPTGTPNPEAFSPDGKTLAIASDGTTRLWDVATGRQIGPTLTGHQGGVTAVTFSPDGKTVASGNSDGTVQLWDVATGRQIGDPLTGHSSAVTTLIFSPDGKTVASGSYDGTTRLWDVASGRQIGDPLTGPADEAGSIVVDSVAFSPDGKTVASGSSDGTVRLWDVSYLVNTIPRLCATLGRSLTRAQWAQYVPPGPAYQDLCP